MKISVSSLPYDKNLVENLTQIIDSGADFLHLDIMDGTLTKNKTVDYKTIKEVNNKTTLFLDCHLMIDEPKNVINEYIKSGVNILTVHYEAFKDKLKLIDTLNYLREKKVIVGLAIEPSTKIEDIVLYEKFFDLLLIMSVEIGKYGQQFIDETLIKIKQARELLKDKLIEVDGGINLDNIDNLKELGVDIIVVGGAYKNADNKKEFITKLK